MVLRETEDLLGASLDALGGPSSLVELTRALRWPEGDADAPGATGTVVSVGCGVRSRAISPIASGSTRRTANREWTLTC